MKKLLGVLLVLYAQYLFAQAPDPDFNDKMAITESRNFLKSATFTESIDYANFDLIYQRLNFTVDPAINYIQGSVYSEVKFLKDNISQIQFDLSDNLKVDSVKCNQVLTTFLHSNNKVSIDLQMPMPKGGVGTMEIFYQGAPINNSIFVSFAVSKHNNVPALWTLSEPYGARDWWPCKESLADKIDSIDVYVTCPPQYKAASNGKLISDQSVNDKRTAHWKHRYPIATYLVAIAVTNYESYSDFLDLPDGKKIEVLNYVYPEYLTTAKTSSEYVLNILSLYNSKFITYPFASEKYGHAQFGWGGGMEHQTMSFMNNLEFGLVAHEMAHQWFGDYITLNSWHDIWLNEGFATYLTGLSYENLLGGYWWPIWKESQINSITSLADGSVYVADTTNVNRIFDGRLSYAKGGYLLHMLRWEMGDETFLKGMQNYLNDPSMANGFASQEKFVKHMEIAADTSFTEFFKDWYYGEGYPIFKLSYYTDINDYGKVKLRINQNSSHSSVDLFEMHIPVRIWKDGKSKDLRLYQTLKNQEFVISADRVDSVQFDPEKWLIAKADKVLSAVEVSEPKEIQIIPEPLANRIRVILPYSSGNETLRIIDLSGRTIRNIVLSGKDSGVDLSGLKNGVYLVEVTFRERKKVEKIIISK